MKAQTSFLIKGIFLITILVLIFVFANQVISANLAHAQLSSEIRMFEKAITISQILTTSPFCLAYEEKNELWHYSSTVTQKVLDIDKIEKFSVKYEEIEPECAKSYDYGYEVLIEYFASEVDTGINNFKEEGKAWRFGSKNFSKGSALRKFLEISFPVSIRVNSSFLQPGRLKLKFVDGELEEIAGMINKVCDTKTSLKQKIFTSYTLFSDGNKICQQVYNEMICRKAYCKVNMEKLYPGSYNVLIENIGGEVFVR